MNQFTFYDTLTQKQVAIQVSNFVEHPLNLYVCGPTVYNFIHIGNARTLVFFDMFVRLLKALGCQVVYTRNITDIDDKIIQTAVKENKDFQKVAEFYTESFHEDVRLLGEQKPDNEPKATDHIAEMIIAVETLLREKIAYLLEDGVYYDVSTFKSYGKLSKKRQEDLMAGVRVDLDAKKKNVGDFALWKFSKPGEPFWEAPFGAGRPGWHIECSVMANKYAKHKLDIHGGGFDLIHPHHENEIAQAEALDASRPFSKYWIHVAFLNVAKQKMSKSLGNMILLRQLLEWFHPEVIRLFLLSAQYRTPLDFSITSLVEKHHSLWRYYSNKEQVLQKLGKEPLEGDSGDNKILRVMAQDFNTPKAIGMIFDGMKSLQKQLQSRGVTLEDQRAYVDMRSASRVLGVFGSEPKTFVMQAEALMLKHLEISKEEIEAKVLARALARKKKEFQQADSIREELDALGVQIQDLDDDKVSWSLSPHFD
jgi:cysteinyl-tRNA synthetase